ncbi:thioesterase family protein [Acinetobacter qingfengensis]|uniref:Thioesterase domain-containing protein n=1 Tax=Acinetobacter qingfengensis TaxID=1262585 RepID=A0A1E7RDG3_9GAMM|nr:thioesterase family protein [Acinetobacter qingfengensis]KAA8735283.1 thioesterase family protein [Acinetobacter qingfengensis]OEY97404.1 hypothetical protein BJI46_09880 [Acinetobacter qingfengensis]
MQKQWTDNVMPSDFGQKNILLQKLCDAFNQSPFLSHNQLYMRISAQQEIEAIFNMQSHLMGNVAFSILHGGVTASILDSIGGIVAMAKIYELANPDQFEVAIEKVTRLATLDIRIDYIAPGRGQYFIAQAEALRLGNKSCLMRMHLHNDQNQLIATGIASYAY